MVRERSTQYRKSTTELQRLTTLIFFLSGGHFSVTFPHSPPTTINTKKIKQKNMHLFQLEHVSLLKLKSIPWFLS